MPIIKHRGKEPRIDPDAFVMSNATLIGEVVIGSNVLVLSNAVLRADFNLISVGESVCIQENAVLNPVLEEAIIIEGHSLIGYGAKLHGGQIGRGAFVGMNSVILQGVRVGENSIIAAGSILTENMKVPSKSLVMGTPAKVVREVSDEDIKWMEIGVGEYMKILKDYQKGMKEWEIRYGTSLR